MQNKKNVVIYGAGTAGKQLFSKLSKVTHNVLFFIDDNNQKKIFCNLEVHSLEHLINSKDLNIDEVYFAITAISENRRSEILNILNENNYIVKLLPVKYKLKRDSITVKDIKTTQIEDLIARSPIFTDIEAIEHEIKDQIILITGAAGSIGSELLSQIIECKPKKVIAFDSSEVGIYNLSLKFKSSNSNLPLIEYVLGSVQDQDLVLDLFEKYRPNIVYHAAAYKHVPIVENNQFAGIKNNFFGTICVAKASQLFNVRKFILISTDKAVRPTNIMGCTKRLAEIYIQALSSKLKYKGDFVNNTVGATIFSMVRFGNVVGSSGSVLPLFEKQILSQKFLTVTDPNVTRFFMSIPEAVQLVLHSSTMCLGGDVFLLNMGTAVKILDIAEKLIKMRGYEPEFIDSEDDVSLLQSNQIGILFTGLRPGEKLFEELLIDAQSQPTSNPAIFRASERFINPETFDEHIEKLHSIIQKNSVSELLEFLGTIDIGYRAL